MTRTTTTSTTQSRADVPDDQDIAVDRVQFDFGITRREAVKVLGAGLLIAVVGGIGGPAVLGQEAPGGRGGRGGGGGRGGRGGGGGFAGGGARNLAARLHIGKDGVITVMTGKVEAGQGSRAEITQAAAEELRVPASRIQLIMADTDLVPDDGMTAGSGTSPRTIPAVRQGAAAARDLLVGLAAKQWGADAKGLSVKDGKVVDADGKRELSYADLAATDDATKAFGGPVPSGVTLTAVQDWKSLGTSIPRPNGRDLVTGGHHYPSDVIRPGMLYGKILRPPTYGAKLNSIDLGPAQAMKDVVVVRDGTFVGVAAPTSWRAQEALDAIAATAKWDAVPQPSSKELYDYLRQKARGGVPKNAFTDELQKAAKTLRQTYHVAYVQHAPMEPRAAVAEWAGDGKLTVWTGTQGPFGVKRELVQAFRVADDKPLPDDRVRVIVPDFGGGFGGKHSGECAVEAARLAKAAGKPVHLRWTREEEFTNAYFRPAAVIDAEASLDDKGKLTSWHFINVNSGPSAVETPYRAGKTHSQFVQSNAPLRHGSYRALASTANNFARECFMDELAEAAGQDPLAFRLAHLENPRLRAVLQEAVTRFNWSDRVKKREPNVGVGLACGTEKGSYVAACAEIAIDRDAGEIRVRRVCQAYECGAVLNPGNLTSQNQGSIIMGLGPALREAMQFEGGKMLNATFRHYLVPRFEDVPEIEVHLLDRKDLPSAGAGETPLIAVAPAIANAVFQATGTRVREMPMRLSSGQARREG